MRKLLYIHPEESIAYLIDRIENTEDGTIYLAADDHPDLFTDPVNMKLLVREAQTFGKEIVIVSENSTVLLTAKNANIDTITANVHDLERENTGEAPQTTPAEHEEQHDAGDEVPVRVVRNEALAAAPAMPRERETVSSVPLFTPPGTAAEYGGMEHDDVTDTGNEHEEEPQPPRTPRHGSPLTLRFVIASFAVLAVLVVGAFYVLSPRLTVTIVPRKEAIHFDFTATADTAASSVNTDTGRIPGQMITIDKEVSDTFTASGKSNQAGKAGGAVTLYNEYSAAAQSLVRNTRLATKDGKIFRLVAATTIPGATVQGGKVTAPGTVSASVVADQPGIAYNIGPSEFSIPGFAGTAKAAKFYGRSATSMSGGSAKEGNVATAADLEKAKAALEDALTAAAKDEVEKNIPKGSVVLPTATQQTTPELTADAPDAQGRFAAHLKATFSVFAFSENDIAALADQQLAKRLGATRQALPSTRVLSYEGETFGANKMSLTFTVKVNELVSGIIKVDELKQALAGKGEAEIRALLKNYDTMESAQAVFSPRWISLAPENTNRITITIEEQ